LLALGAEPEARDTLRYLSATQIEDGHWQQNQWLGGRPFWEGIQLDETAFPVLLAAALDEREALAGIEVEDMVRRALGYIARTGPATEQDRWEESTGINPFTPAVCIVALVAGAPLLPPPTCDSGLGFEVVTLDVGGLLPGERVDFTWRWRETGAWQGRDYRVAIQPADLA
jgi:glucoamylase